MKTYIFGTGKYCTRFIRFIPTEYISGYLDNDPDKVGRQIDGKQIYSPDSIDPSEIERIVILVKDYSAIYKQLLSLGIDESRICIYKDLYKYFGKRIEINTRGNKLPSESWGKSNNERSVLLISHELSRTGVPVAIMHMAELLEKKGWNTVIAGMESGSLIYDLRDKGLDYIDDFLVVNDDKAFKDFISSFKFLIIGTMAATDCLSRLTFYDGPILIWINEKYERIFREHYISQNKNNYLYFADGKKAENVFLEFYPDRKIEQLLYFLPDLELMGSRKVRSEAKTKIRFTFVGSLSYRKAPDIIIDAIGEMGEEKKDMSILFIGGATDDLSIDWDWVQQMMPEVEHRDEVSQKELQNIFANTDVMICPSRDDTVPIVVTQAFQNCIPCIVSDDIGQAEMMKGGKGGFVFANGSVKELAKAMTECIIRRDELKRMGLEGRAIFESYFSEKSMSDFLDNRIFPLVRD